MKTLYLLTLTMLLASCAKAQPNIDAVRLDCIGQPLPKIRHMIEMKVLSDTLFSYMNAMKVSDNVSCAVQRLINKNISSSSVLK